MKMLMAVFLAAVAQGQTINGVPSQSISGAFPAFLQDFSASTFKLPTGAGFTTSANSMLGYDSTATNPKIWNGADRVLAPISGSVTTGRCLQSVVSGSQIMIVDSGSTNCGGGGATALSAITAAAAGNTIANGDNAQVWNWATTTSGRIGMKFGETTASTSAGTPYLVQITSLIGSTATALNVANSLNGSQTLPALSITPTWNTTGVVDAALLINATNTASGTASKLIDAQIGGTTEWNVDKAGNTLQAGSVSTGVGTGVAGAFSCAQGTAATVPANSFGWTCPTTMTTSVLLQSPNAVPAANQVMLFPAPTSNVSAWTWTTFTLTGMGSTFSAPLSLATNTVTCPTCVTSAAALTSNAVVIGGGGQASSSISADTTTTHALFATAGAPAFRAVVAGDIPTLNQNTTGTASNLSGTPALPNGTTATTQAASDNSTDLATDAYVTTAVANAVAAVNPAVAVQAATAAALPAVTYNNGVSGIGATLTQNSAAVLVVDGYTVLLNDRIIVKNQAAPAQNGVYLVTTLGTGVVAFVLTRALDFDQPSDINNSGLIPVDNNGTVNAKTGWFITSTVVTMGTDAITFTQFAVNSANIVTATAPGVGLCHFAGSTQVCTSSAVALGSADVSGTLAVANGGTGVTAAHGNSTQVQLSDGTGLNNFLTKFDANGNVTNGPVAPTGAVVGTSDTQTITGKLIRSSATALLTTNNAFTLGTVTANHLACFTASNTVGNCTGLPSNNVLGIFADTSGNILSSGQISTVALDATVSVTFGDILCGSSTSASTIHDNGTTVCTNGNWVGVVQTTAASTATAVALLRLQ